MNTTKQRRGFQKLSQSNPAGRMAWESDAVEVGSAMIKLKNILVPIDFSEPRRKRFDYAVPSAKQSMQRLPCYALGGGGPKRRPNRVEVWFADLPKVRVLLELDLTRERFAFCSARIRETSSSLPAMSSFDASQAEHQRQSMGIRLTERPTSDEQKVYRFLMESLVGRAVPFLEFYPFPLHQIGEL